MFDWKQEAEILANRFGTERMRTAIESLSVAYRAGKGTLAPRLDEDLLVAAYLAVRFPATFAANLAAGKATHEAITARTTTLNFTPQSLLDLGAGCGTASIAAQEIWPSLQQITAIEQIPAMVNMGKQFLPDATWRTAKFQDLQQLPPHDIVVCSYALGESRGDTMLLEKAWQAASQLLILIEPGTPHAFQGIRAARTRLIALGASILAPCPNAEACPAKDLDWCHFAARLNRSALHRRLKGGTLGYEDEKFSYVAAWRGPLAEGSPRVLRHPLIQPGRIEAELCIAPVRRRIVTTKRNKDAFRVARKLAWGDVLVLDSTAGTELPPGDDPGPETPQD